MISRCVTFIITSTLCTLSLIGQKTENVTLISNDEIKLTLEHHTEADLSKKDWLKFKLRNKTNKKLYFENINYSINTFEINKNNERELKPGALGRSKMYNLLPEYHNVKKITADNKFYELPAKKEITFWKYASNTASAILEKSLSKSQEICGLMEFKVEYGLHEDLVDIYNGEEAFCFNWINSTDINPKLIANHLEEKISDVTQRKINSAIINTLVLNESVINQITVDTLIYGIEKRGYTQNKSERMALLKTLDKRNGFENDRIISHYQTCMYDKNCEWIEDLKYYWNNKLFDTLISNSLFINEKIKILEIQSADWRKNDDRKNKLFKKVISTMDFDFNYVPDQDGFSKWYNKVKKLASTRHPEVIKYLSGLLDNETFLKIEDWSGQKNKRIITNRDKAKIINVRICDVAYVGLLRALNKVDIEKKFEGFKYSQSVLIDEKWRGSNEANSDGIRLKNAYTLLPLNLSMGEKYYYLNFTNKLEIRKLLRRYGF